MTMILKTVTNYKSTWWDILVNPNRASGIMAQAAALQNKDKILYNYSQSLGNGQKGHSGVCDVQTVSSWVRAKNKLKWYSIQVAWQLKFEK